MNMTDMVREFHRAFLVDCPKRPTIPSRDIAALRSSLIDEERLELFVAEKPAEALDAIADLLYVVHGAAAAYGFTGEQVEAAFREVHRSNMSKLWTREEVDAGIGDNIARPVLGEMFVVTRPDGKVVKSPSYSPARLKEIVGGAQ